jgi:curli biogenesis system outer membrane secretion channel CsgG
MSGNAHHSGYVGQGVDADEDCCHYVAAPDSRECNLRKPIAMSKTNVFARNLFLGGILTALWTGLAGTAVGAEPSSGPVVDRSATTQALAALPPKPFDQRVAVTIYEFRSGVQEVNAATATDMFTTALIKSGQFRVVERERLNQGVVIEKQLNAAGQTTGDTAQSQLRGVRYIFEGIISEANAGEDARQASVNIGGLNLGKGTNKDSITIDVRIVDADTGDVLDAVDVSQMLNDSSANIGGTLALASTVAAMHGRNVNPLTPDVNYQSSHKDSVDRALRACIEASVLELAKRMDANAAAAAPR